MSIDLSILVPFIRIQKNEFSTERWSTLCKQDYYGRTILHIIIEQNDNVLVQLFRRFYQQHTEMEYTEKEDMLTKELKNLLKIYDHQGYTILHRAVKYNLLDLVEDILKFCKKFKINLADYELLGTGDSILHLALKGKLFKMCKLILEYEPVLADVKNYAGHLPEM